MIITKYYKNIIHNMHSVIKINTLCHLSNNLNKSKKNSRFKNKIINLDQILKHIY